MAACVCWFSVTSRLCSFIHLCCTASGQNETIGGTVAVEVLLLLHLLTSGLHQFYKRHSEGNSPHLWCFLIGWLKSFRSSCPIVNISVCFRLSVSSKFVDSPRVRLSNSFKCRCPVLDSLCNLSKTDGQTCTFTQ